MSRIKDFFEWLRKREPDRAKSFEILCALIGVNFSDFIGGKIIDLFKVELSSFKPDVIDFLTEQAMTEGDSAIDSLMSKAYIMTVWKLIND